MSEQEKVLLLPPHIEGLHGQSLGIEDRKVLDEYCRGDLYLFNKYILGYKDLNDVHRGLCDFVQKEKGRKKLILMPRNSFKSSVITCGYSLFRAVQNGNIRILINSEVMANAKDYLAVIKDHIEHNANFRRICGHLDARASEDTWSRHEIRVATRNDPRIKEPTICVGGIETTKVGAHYDLIIADDLVSQGNIGSVEMIDKTLVHFQLLLSLLDPRGTILVVGTRWSDNDLYGNILETGTFKNYITKAYQPDGSLTFPQVLTEEFLKEQEKEQGSYLFSCLYMNDPIVEKLATFKRKWFKYYSEKPDCVRRYMTVDPSVGTGRDYSAIMVVGQSRSNDLYILEYVNEKLSPNELVGRIFDMHIKYKPQRSGIETVAFQKLLQYAVRDEMRRRNHFFIIEELRPSSTQTKQMRIRALQPRFENGTIWMRKDMRDLENQLIRFPAAGNDDLIDALAYVLDLLSTPDQREEIPEYIPANPLTGY